MTETSGGYSAREKKETWLFDNWIWKDAQHERNAAYFVMPGLEPGIHVLLFFAAPKDVDGRVKPGHDDGWSCMPEDGGWMRARSSRRTTMALASRLNRGWPERATNIPFI